MFSLTDLWTTYVPDKENIFRTICNRQHIVPSLRLRFPKTFHPNPLYFELNHPPKKPSKFPNYTRIELH